MDPVTSIFTAFGLSAPAGLNAYLPLLIVALAARFGLFQIVRPYDVVTSNWAIGILAVLFLIETFADKFPAFNHVNDVVQTVVRPAAGAILFASTNNFITHVNPMLALLCGLLIAGGVHATKSLVIRPVVTATTAGVGTPFVSILEDILGISSILIAIFLPALIVLVVLVALLFGFFLYRNYRRMLKRRRGVYVKS